MSSSLSVVKASKKNNVQSQVIYEAHIVQMKIEKLNESFALKQ